jgi:hypothetical protein
VKTQPCLMDLAHQKCRHGAHAANQHHNILAVNLLRAPKARMSSSRVQQMLLGH